MLPFKAEPESGNIELWAYNSRTRNCTRLLKKVSTIKGFSLNNCLRREKEDSLDKSSSEAKSLYS